MFLECMINRSQNNSSDQISAIIHRSNIKTFESSEIKDKTQGSNAKINGIKECTLGQKHLDLAHVREYNIKLLFQYDFVTSYLFEAEHLVTSQTKVS